LGGFDEKRLPVHSVEDRHGPHLARAKRQDGGASARLENFFVTLPVGGAAVGVALRNGHRHFCMSAGVHDLHIIGSDFLLATFVMSSNNCEISAMPSMDHLTTARDAVSGSSQKPLRHSRHSGVPVSNGQA
jgi:hypothetical protein